MWKQVQEVALVPLVTRGGSVLAGYLISQGVNSDYAHQIGIGVTALALVLLDIAAERWAKSESR